MAHVPGRPKEDRIQCRPGDDPETTALVLLGILQRASDDLAEGTRYRMEQWDDRPTNVTVYLDDRGGRDVLFYVDLERSRVEGHADLRQYHDQLITTLYQSFFRVTTRVEPLTCAKCDGLGGWMVERGFTPPPAESPDEYDVVCPECDGEGVV